ncbi:MAG: hypothetical protein GY752_09125 [bacterium]|nr:hypothetical protein [bacterium]
MTTENNFWADLDDPSDETEEENFWGDLDTTPEHISFDPNPDEPIELSASEKVANVAKGAGERAGDIAGSLLEGIDITAKSLEEKYPLGGFEWAEGDILPTYLSGKELAEKQPESILAKPAEALKNADFGYKEQKNWQHVKDAFSKGGAFSGSAYADVVEYGLEQGLKSVPDMVGAVFALPAYLLARSEEIGQERAKNKGKEGAELEDILEAAPFAIGSALMERIGAKGMTSDVVENIGKEALKEGVQEATKRIAKEGGKGFGKEAGTEAIQEGILEYVGEKFGTDAKMSIAESWDRALGGAVAGGITGGTIATTTATMTESLKGIAGQPPQGLEQSPEQMTEGIEGDISVESIPEEFQTPLDDNGQPIQDPNAVDTSAIPGESDLPFVPADQLGLNEHDIGQPIDQAPVSMEPVVAPLDSLGTELDTGQPSITGDALNDELSTTQERITVSADVLSEEVAETQPVAPTDELTETPTPKEVTDEVKEQGTKETTPEATPEVVESKEVDATKVDVVDEVETITSEEPTQTVDTSEMETEITELEGRAQKAYDNFDMVEHDTLMAEADAIRTEIADAQKTTIDEAAHEAQTSPENDLAEPTDAQIEAGNYKKGHVKVQGLDIAIENPLGSERTGKDASGKAWSVTMKDHYGYVKRTEGADGDQVDVFVGSNPESDKVFVIDQENPTTGKFDEHKVILGAKNLNKAKLTYNRNYAKGWKGMGAVTEMTMDEFKTWLKEGDTKKRVANAKAKTIKPGTKTLKSIKLEKKFTDPNGNTVVSKSPFRKYGANADTALRNIDKKRDVGKKLLRCVNR